MKRAILSLMSAAALLTGCSDGVGPGSQISLSFSGGASVSSPNPGFLNAPSISDGANTLVITKARWSCGRSSSNGSRSSTAT